MADIMAWLAVLVAANPLAIMTIVIVGTIAIYVVAELYSQHREEVAMRGQLEDLKRERDRLWKDLQ